ncbi:MAG: mechanosensitive ion channel family protein [Candidatus Diapherotrites archaeon]|uniref:Mechanosensitive ion channel family protein n=1 Tax=Candidatus Iainarchaeum sp. TaxID=3101447 RepID=A0A938YYD8_9ARCH|nr:mechanosensitive ion channel family protein [Candidatus Diapherotrites archaeon]
MDGYFSIAAESLEMMWQNLQAIVPSIIAIVVLLIIILVVYKIASKAIYHGLRRTVRRKDEIKTVMAIWRYIFLFIVALVLILTFSGSLTAAGISIGLLSAALGWALQKPITGIAAWMMILIKRPFKVGDRVIIDNIKGDISDITMFYIVLSEFGGTVGGEETSGRTILIPTALLFDKPITNYTLSDAYILDEVGAEFTYETNLGKAEKIMLDAAKKFTKDAIERKGKQPATRVFFNPSGMQVKVRYNVAARERQQVMSDITREVYEKVMKEKDLEFAYPHTELVWGRRPLRLQGNSLKA